MLLSTLAPVPVIEKELLVMLPLKLAAELVLVKDSSELEIPKPDEGKLEVLAIPEDGDVKLPVNVKFVNGYGAVELGPDGCVVLLPLLVVEGGDVVLEIPLSSDVAAVEAVPFPLTDSGASVGVPRVVELPRSVVGEAVPLRVEEVTILDPDEIGAVVRFVKGYGVELGIVTMPDVRPVDVGPVTLLLDALASGAILLLGVIGAVPGVVG